MSYFAELGVNLVNCQVVKGHQYERLLEKHGFLDSRIKLHFFYYRYQEVDDLKELAYTHPDLFHLMYGDIDSMPSSIPQAT